MSDWVINHANDIRAAEGHSHANAINFGNLFPNNMPDLNKPTKHDNYSMCVDDNNDNFIYNWSD